MARQTRYQKIVIKPKHPLASKTMWLAILVGSLSLGVSVLDAVTQSSVISDNPDTVKIVGFATAISIGILRWITTTPVKRFTDKY